MYLETYFSSTFYFKLDYCYNRITTMSCCATSGGFDLIGGLQKSPVTHDECRGNCSKYDWCYGIRITYEGSNFAYFIII